MRLKVLFMQRKEDYPEEYGPEALVAIDEFCVDENPEYWEKLVEKTKKENEDEAAGFAVIEIEVDQAEIRRRCLGQAEPLKGEIQS